MARIGVWEGPDRICETLIRDPARTARRPHPTIPEHPSRQAQPREEGREARIWRVQGDILGDSSRRPVASQGFSGIRAGYSVTSYSLRGMGPIIQLIISKNAPSIELAPSME